MNIKEDRYLTERDDRYVTDGEGGNVRRLGSAIGFATISLLDLLALDDITTAGAWLPEILFLVASVPALMTLAYFTFRGSALEKLLKKGSSAGRLAP